MRAPEPIRAPQNAVAWAARHGWIRSGPDAFVYAEAGELVLLADDDGIVRDVEDDTLAGMMRIDAEAERLYERLVQIHEDAARSLTPAPS